MNKITGKKITNLAKEELMQKIKDFDRVVVDLGCGDGKWAYRYAQDNPHTFVIGIDADAASLEKISHKVARKPAKGGLVNLIYVHAFAEDLPIGLNQIADQIYVNFPWGSLLAGVVRAEQDILQSITSIARPECSLDLCTTYHKLYEPQMIETLELPELNAKLQDSLKAGWYQHGWELMSWESVESQDETAVEQIPQTSWWKQISAERHRQVWMAKLLLDNNTKV